MSNEKLDKAIGRALYGILFAIGVFAFIVAFS